MSAPEDCCCGTPGCDGTGPWPDPDEDPLAASRGVVNACGITFVVAGLVFLVVRYAGDAVAAVVGLTALAVAG